MMTRQKLLITGASGYIGRPTVTSLISDGHEVHALGRNDPKIKGLIFHRADLLSRDGVDEALRAADASTLLHLAWSVPPNRFWTDLANLSWIGASLDLFRSFSEAGGQRIVGAGSCAEYDWSRSPLIEQSTPIKPATLYGNAKASVWSMLESLARQQGLSAGWGRLFFLYGPGEPRLKLVSETICSLLDRRNIHTTEGSQKRDFIHVEDAGRALALLATSPVTGPVNIASGHCGPVRDVLKHLESEIGGEGLIKYGTRQMSPGDPPELAAEISRLRDELGFQPSFNLAQGLSHTIRWWRSSGHRVQNGQTPREVEQTLRAALPSGAGD